jgi:hypothetical protein
MSIHLDVTRPTALATALAETTGRNLDAVQALRSKLFKVLTSSDTPIGYYLSFAPGGFPQSDYTLSFLKDPSQVDLWFDFSQLVNAVPLSAGDFSMGGTLLWDRYSDWLARYEPPPFSLTPDEEKKLRSAEEYIDKNFDAYGDHETLWSNAFFEWQTLVVMPPADRPKNYSTLLAKAKAAMDQAKRAWDIKGHRSQYETEYAIVQDLSERDPVRTKQRLKSQLGTALKAPGGDFYQTRIIPTTLLDPGFTWPHFTFSHNETHEYSKESSVKWGANVTVGALLWNATADSEGKLENHEQNSDVNNMSMEFDLLRAPILRPWFSTYLLFSQAWKWGSSSPENPSGGDLLSDGNLPASGSWQMIPTEAIFVRNLKVKLDMTSKVNKDSLTETKSSLIAEGGWGPIKIKGTVETKQGSKQFDFVEETDGFSCPQPQIIAFFCVLMPKEPNPNWALWKE